MPHPVAVVEPRRPVEGVVCEDERLQIDDDEARERPPLDLARGIGDSLAKPGEVLRPLARYAEAPERGRARDDVRLVKAYACSAAHQAACDFELENAVLGVALCVLIRS